MKRKKKQYDEAVKDRRGTFTPFIATCDAILDVEAMGQKLFWSHRLGLSKNPSLHYNIMRSVSVCLRGSRIKWTLSMIEDGSAMPRLEVC